MKKKTQIRAGDEILVISGADKGRKGEVLAIDGQKARVKGVRMQTHFDKKEGIQKREGWLDRSNIKLVKKADPEKQRAALKKRKKK